MIEQSALAPKCLFAWFIIDYRTFY